MKIVKVNLFCLSQGIINLTHFTPLHLGAASDYMLFKKSK